MSCASWVGEVPASVEPKEDDMSDEPKCFDCGSTDCELVGETYAFCDEHCRDSFMAGLFS